MGTHTINILRKAAGGRPDKFNILTFPTHERYETQLCKTNHNFYSFTGDGIKNWNENYAPIPDNYHSLPRNSIYQGIRYDFLLVQSKFGQFQAAQAINERIGVPMIILEHTLPITQLNPEHVEASRGWVGDINVFISEFSRDEWALIGSPQTEVIHHSVDTSLFKPSDIEQSPHVLTVANDFVNRDYCLNYLGWQRITEGIQTKLVGDTEGLSESAASTEELVNEYNKAQIFLNTSTLSPIPTSLLEAMSCGCAVVTTATCMIPEVIKHGENGMMSNDEEELRGYIKQLLEDEDLRNKLGAAARETILSNFSEDEFKNNWNRIFDMAYEVIK
jgi:glycosyltransferase involved in cell wall biosynthesis